ncbi:MAG TPA: DinB family protein [Daejeonella sp.]
MKFNKSELIDELRAEIDNQVDIVNKHYINSPGNRLNKPALDGGWSVLQCLDHLNSYGDYYLPKINEALEKAHIRSDEFYRSGWLGDYFTKIMSPETGTKKHKAFKGHVPGASLDAAGVLSEFLRQEELLLLYLQKARALDIGSARIPVSISKWITMKLGDTFRFLIAHNRRHVLQAERNFNSQDLTPSVTS